MSLDAATGTRGNIRFRYVLADTFSYGAVAMLPSRLREWVLRPFDIPATYSYNWKPGTVPVIL